MDRFVCKNISHFQPSHYVSFKVLCEMWIWWDVDRILSLSPANHYAGILYLSSWSVRLLRAVHMTSKTVSSILRLARFEVLTVLLLKTEVFLNMMPCHWVSSSQHLKDHTAFKTSWTTWQITQNYILGDMILESSVLSYPWLAQECQHGRQCFSILSR
jgi:hypothetical protein